LIVAIAEDLEQIALQERELAFDHFDEATAWSLGAHLRELAVSRRFPTLVIDVRRFGQPLFYATVGQTVPDHAEWIRRKSNVVARFHRSSYALGLEMERKDSSLTERYGLPLADYATHGGSFPLRIVNAGVIGSVTVSGLPQREDHELAVEGICAMIGRDYSSVKLSA
jgi:uncharacterized protein (UPF0303 family)